MPIPVPDKRIHKASAINLMLPWGSFPHPYQGDTVNNAWIDERDRMFAAWAFTGVSVSVGTTAAVITTTGYTLPGTLIGYRVMESPFVFVGDIDQGHKTSDGIPTVTFDVDSGYQPGNIIIYNSSDIYMCADNTAGAAVWRKLN